MNPVEPVSPERKPDRAPDRAVVALGSNLGDRRDQLERALVELDSLAGVRVVARSTLHETEPVGGPPGQPRYLNAVAIVATELGPRELLHALLQLEQEHGRIRERCERDAPRTLDLDLLFHGTHRSEDPELRLPHPRLEQRSFVLAPLAELEPDRVLEGCGLSVRDRLAQLEAAAT
jgi:2-amino-4-hydroxy-6-hydroxymethyldihydropteridine diphosphokinase